jgi:hypothetical protein
MNFKFWKINVFPNMVRDQVNFIPQSGECLNALINTNRRAAWFEERLWRDHQDFHRIHLSFLMKGKNIAVKRKHPADFSARKMMNKQTLSKKFTALDVPGTGIA